MRKLPARQVHLDFHTSQHIPGVGSKFNKEEFQAALKEGNVGSVTVFAKCHHGYCYYPTKVGAQHPTMDPDFDLTGAMVEAAHEIGVDAPIYITTGFSEYDAAQHPEWRMCEKDGTPRGIITDPAIDPEAPRPDCKWELMCMSGDYAELIYETEREIVNRYPVVDGLFFDIVYLHDTCYCPNCLKGMRELGLDPDNIEDARKYYRISHLRFMDNCDRILHEKHPNATLFFNSGGAEIYAPEYHAGQTHYEMEDLPTVWGGYNKMPPRASVMSRYGKEYLGMTGKFHTTWGEFGGYKNPDALKYEALMMAMYGAKCSVGDQLPPNGKPDMETYKLIGHAFRALEKIEPWAYPASPTAKLGVYLSRCGESDEGLHTMLLESHIDFEVVMPGDDLSRFDCLVLPDSTELSDEETARVNAFIADGGAAVFNGTSALKDGKFTIDAGAEYVGGPAFSKDYFMPGKEIGLPFGNARFVCYEGAQRTRVTDGEVLAEVYEPWFDRTYGHFSSHQNTPYKDEPAEYPAAVRKGRVVYLAHPLCRLYMNYGAQLFREAFIRALLTVYEPQYTVKLPSGGRTRLTRQADKNRYVFHAAYMSPVRRGIASVLEDVVPIYQLNADVKIPEKVTRVMLVPSMEEIPFEQKNGRLAFTVPCVNIYQAVEIRTEE